MIKWKRIVCPTNRVCKVVEMAPLDFLSKVPSPCREGRTALEDLNFKGCWSESSVRYIWERIGRGEELDPPMLDYSRMFRGFPSHEGRHRALVAYRRGIKRIPVLVFGKEGSNPSTVFVEIRMLKDAPHIVGSDMKTYGPFKKDGVYAIPKENARIFLKLGLAVATRREAKKPTLKELFKGEVLNGYVEARKVKPLVEEEKEEVTPYMEEKIPLILSKLRAMQKITGMVREADLYDAVRPLVTKVGFDEIRAYLLRKGEIYSPRPDFLKSTEEEDEVKLKSKDTARLADLFLDLLTDAGVSFPSRFKGEFEKAMDIYKPYDENVELIEEAAHHIILRETGKEYPVGEALRKAREKVERLIKEIREAKGE